MAETDVASILADPRWLAHRYDRHRDEVHFVKVSREDHRAVSFLTEPEIVQASGRHAVPRRLLSGLQIDQAPLHLILHSGLTGSTLLTRALDIEGVAMTLSEPPILTDVVSYLLAKPQPAEASALLDDVLRLLARPFGQGEAVIVKAGAVGNALGGHILAQRASSKALCLYAPLPAYLASIARKGLWGRVWGRRLFTTLRSAGLTDLGFGDAELFEQTDLQICALAWLSLHRIMIGVGSRFSDRTRVLESETLFSGTEAAIGGIANHFGLAIDVAALANDPVFRRHSKTGEEFDADRRAAELREAAEVHREEIGMVVQWAQKVAEAQQIRLELPGLSRL